MSNVGGWLRVCSVVGRLLWCLLSLMLVLMLVWVELKCLNNLMVFGILRVLSGLFLVGMLVILWRIFFIWCWFDLRVLV